MSSITIRNVVGQNEFSIPTTETEAEAATAALTALLDNILWLEFDDARVLVVDVQNSTTPELAFVVSTFFYNGSIIPSVLELRSALNAELLGDPSISSIGDINIEDARPGDEFYHQWPEIDWLDSRGKVVQFKAPIPAGAQIELGKYSTYRRRPDLPYPPHIGNRYRRFLRLPVDGQIVSLDPWILNTRKRNVFRARYVWPCPPGTPAPAPGIFGPVAPYGIVTANRWERDTNNGYLYIEAAPSGYGQV
jgi:hypothetical protein